jgi:hypothetical protein
MSASTGEIIERLATLVTLFNRGSLDLPDALLDRNASFRLNGVSYEEAIGHADSDPLVRLIARGPGAYRFLAKAVHYAMPDARITMGALTRSSRTAGFELDGSATLSGVLRGSTEPFTADCDVALAFDQSGQLTAVAVRVDEHPLARLREARAR